MQLADKDTQFIIQLPISGGRFLPALLSDLVVVVLNPTDVLAVIVGNEDAVLAVVAPSIGPVHVIAMSRGIVEDVSLTLVHFPIGHEAFALSVDPRKSHGNLAGREGTVPHTHLAQAALEELAVAVTTPRHTQLKALEWCRLAAARGLCVLDTVDIHFEGRAVVGA